MLHGVSGSRVTDASEPQSQRRYLECALRNRNIENNSKYLLCPFKLKTNKSALLKIQINYVPSGLGIYPQIARYRLCGADASVMALTAHTM